MLVDYHCHIPRDDMTKKYDIDFLLRDTEKNHFDKRLISAIKGSSIQLQNDCAISLARQYPDIFIACGVINPKEDDCINEVERLCKIKEIRAIEFDPLEHGYIPESCRSLETIFSLMEKNGLIANVFTGWGFRTAPFQWEYWVEKYPNLKFVYLHMGGNDFGYSCIDVAKKHKNILLETSDMYELPVWHIALRELEEDRFIFGTQFPEKFSEVSLEIIDSIPFTTEGREKLFSTNAMNLLNIH